MTKQEQRQEIIGAFAAQGKQAIHGKGGFFVKGEGWISFSEARKRTAVAVPENLKRSSSEMLPWGEYATVAAVCGARIR